MHFVHCGPPATLSFGFREATLFIALLDVFGLAFLLVRVVTFVSAWHCAPPPRPLRRVQQFGATARQAVHARNRDAIVGDGTMRGRAVRVASPACAVFARRSVSTR